MRCCEQAELVAQFLCCIPLAGIEALLTWLKPAVPQEEQDQLLAQVWQVLPPIFLKNAAEGRVCGLSHF